MVRRALERRPDVRGHLLGVVCVDTAALGVSGRVAGRAETLRHYLLDQRFLGRSYGSHWRRTGFGSVRKVAAKTRHRQCDGAWSRDLPALKQPSAGGFDLLLARRGSGLLLAGRKDSKRGYPEGAPAKRFSSAFVVAGRQLCVHRLLQLAADRKPVRIPGTAEPSEVRCGLGFPVAKAGASARIRQRTIRRLLQSLGTRAVQPHVAELQGSAGHEDRSPLGDVRLVEPSLRDTGSSLRVSPQAPAAAAGLLIFCCGHRVRSYVVFPALFCSGGGRILWMRGDGHPRHAALESVQDSGWRLLRAPRDSGAVLGSCGIGACGQRGCLAMGWRPFAGESGYPKKA